MLRVPVVKGNLNKALKIFKKRFKKTGILKSLKEKQQFTKKSKKKKLMKDRAIYKQNFLNNKDNE